MYCEKPLGLLGGRVQGVREAVNENSVAFQFGTQQRSSFSLPSTLLSWPRNGRIGDIKTIMVGLRSPRPQ
jgi:hypothetical protein